MREHTERKYRKKTETIEVESRDGLREKPVKYTDKQIQNMSL